MKSPKKILLIRNDKLGDFMLAWPALSLLKNQYPESTITVLIPSYTKPMADICPWIDNVITDDSHTNTAADALYLYKILKPYDFDISISLFSEMRTALALWFSRVPKRVGPATKLAQLFLNNKLRQNRSTSSKPEYEYNLDLIRYFISSSGETPCATNKAPYLKFDSHEINDIKQQFIKKNNINAGDKIIFIHAGTGGSAINLSLSQFAELAGYISKSNSVHFVLTAGPQELAITNELSDLLINIKHSVYHSKEGLVNFSKFINICDLFISGSTGPLHISGALNVATAAFYPARQSATKLRWQTINEDGKRLSFSPKIYVKSATKLDVDIKQCALKISHFLS